VTETDRTPPRRCLPLECWPLPDREAWEAAHRRGGLLDEEGLAVNWAAVTSRLIASGYGRFLSFLEEKGGLDPKEQPSSRITPSRVEAYVAELRLQNHSSTVAARLLQLVRAASVMAPAADWRWLRKIRSRLRHMATPARDDRARLVATEDLLDLAFKLMRRADTRNDTLPHKRALWFRDGLMIAMLCSWAPRARNVAGTSIGTNLQRRGDIWWACFRPDETKNKRPIEIPLPEFLNQPIKRYLELYRPSLLARADPSPAGEAFWLSHRGLPLTAKEVGQRITAVTRRELGKPVNPHLFRKVIPTELAIHDPEHVGVAQALLGHADYSTTQRAYNMARSIDAGRKHQQVLRSIRASR
jgi:integrase